MKLNILGQPPLCTTMMGVARGVLNYYHIALDDPLLFGISGHAFALNIHPELVPSGPQRWDKRRVRDMLSGTGIDMTLLGSIGPESSMDDRKRVEASVRSRLDGGDPCAMLNLENQLILGYDDSGLMLAQPWPNLSFPPNRLTFGKWPELGNELHVEFYGFAANHRRPNRESFLESLQFAMRAWQQPKSQTSEPYGFGPDGYANWRAGLAAGMGASNGNRWNGRVWSECRRFAAAYMHEVGRVIRAPEACDELASYFIIVADQLEIASDKSRPKEEQLAALTAAEHADQSAIKRMIPLIA